jgi:hypothetical protein
MSSVSAIAERSPGPGVTAPTLTLAAQAGFGLPPGSLPVEAVRAVLRRYQAGRATGESLVKAIDTYGEVLEVEIARKAVTDMADFLRTVRRLELLHERISMRVSQARWLAEFPSAAAPPRLPLTCRQAEVPRVLEALREVQLEPRLLELGDGPKPRRRGRSRAMAALADAGVTSIDVGNELGVSGSRAWSWLDGNQPAPPELRFALERLVGVDQAQVVLDGIPQRPRARAPSSPAVQALHDAGVTAEEVAVLIPVQPSSVRRWLRGRSHPPPKLAVALEQLVGVGSAARIIALIP